MNSTRVSKAVRSMENLPKLACAIQYRKPSSVCDFQESNRYLVEDFAIQFCRNLQKRDFVMKTEDFSARRKGKREYLNDSLTRNLIKSLNEYFQIKVEIPRIRVGKRQEIETLVNEETLSLGMYLRDEKRSWTPRVVSV